MQNAKFNILLVVVVALSGSFTFAQQTPSIEKRALASEFRKLTGANKVNSSINFSSDGIREILSAVVEQDKELTEAQKQELRKPVWQMQPTGLTE